MKQRFVVWRYAPVLPRPLLRNIAPLPPPFANANSFLFLVHSAGVFPCDSSHRLKSFIRTLCSTTGCLTRTFNSVSPSPVSSTPWSHRVPGTGQVATGDQAGAEGHAEKVSMIRLLFAIALKPPTGRSLMPEAGRV